MQHDNSKPNSVILEDTSKSSLLPTTLEASLEACLYYRHYFPKQIGKFKLSPLMCFLQGYHYGPEPESFLLKKYSKLSSFFSTHLEDLSDLSDYLSDDLSKQNPDFRLNSLFVGEIVTELQQVVESSSFSKRLSQLSLTGQYEGYRPVTRQEFENFSKRCRGYPDSLKIDKSRFYQEVFLVPDSTDLAYKKAKTKDGNVLREKDYDKHGYSPITLVDNVANRPLLVHVAQPRVKLLKKTQVNARGKKRRKTIVISPSFKQAGHEITTRTFDTLTGLMSMKNFMSCARCSEAMAVDEAICSKVWLDLLIEAYKAVDLSNVIKIGIDEHSIHKGQSYVTVIFCLETGRLLYICEGKTKGDVQPFFERLKALGFDKNIEYFSCDCASGFIALAQEFLPDAKIVIDDFHAKRDFGKRCTIPFVERQRKQEQAKLELMQAEQKKKGFDEVRIACKEARQNNLSGDQRVEHEILEQENTANMELGHVRNKIKNAEDKLKQLGFSASDITEIKQKTSEEAIARSQSNLDLIKALRFHLDSYTELQEQAEAEDALERIKDIFRLVEANPQMKEFAQLSEKFGSIWEPNTTPEMTRQILAELQEKLPRLVPKNEKVQKFCSFLARRTEQLIYAGEAQVSNSRVEGMNAQAKALQRVTRGVKSARKYLLCLMVLFSDVRPSWRSDDPLATQSSDA